MTSTLRQLSAIYLTAASAFVVMIVLAQHPDWNSAVHTAGRTAADFTVTTAVATNQNVLKPGFAFAKEKGGDLLAWAGNRISPPMKVAKTAPQRKPQPVRVARSEPKPALAAKKEIAPPEKPENKDSPAVVVQMPTQTPMAQDPDQQQTAPVVALNTLRPTIAEQKPAPQIVTPPKQLQLAPQPDEAVHPTVSRAGPGPAELVRVTQRLKSSLTQEMLDNFELFLYVSKADTGSWSQRMYVFTKKPGGNLDLVYNWPVSTGRDKWELDVHGKKQNSFTPQGYYELDPGRMHVRYHSSQWNQPMPYAMFFNWEQNGYQTGLAIHGASGDDIALLGQRASAGCVRLAPENARILFTLIRANYKGLAPKFAYDRRTASMANNGVLMHDKGGKLQLADGYKVLVFIENYGGNDVVAALY